MNSKITLLLLTLIMAGCGSNPVKIKYGIDQYGAAFPIVDGVEYVMTDEERRNQLNLLLQEYCPAE